MIATFFCHSMTLNMTGSSLVVEKNPVGNFLKFAMNFPNLLLLFSDGTLIKQVERELKTHLICNEFVKNKSKIVTVYITLGNDALLLIYYSNRVFYKKSYIKCGDIACMNYTVNEGYLTTEIILWR